MTSQQFSAEESMMSTHAEQDHSPAYSVFKLPLDQIVVEEQIRKSVLSVDDPEIKELSRSLDTYGQLQPVIVTPMKGKQSYLLVAGHRRVLAAEILEWPAVDARLENEGTPRNLLQWHENEQRKDLTPLDRVLAIQQMKTDHFSVDQIAQEFGKSVAWVQKHLTVGNMEPEAATLLAHSPQPVPLDVIYEVATLPAKEQEAFASEIMSKHMTRQQVRSEAAKRKKQSGKKNGRGRPSSTKGFQVTFPFAAGGGGELTLKFRCEPQKSSADDIIKAIGEVLDSQVAAVSGEKSTRSQTTFACESKVTISKSSLNDGPFDSELSRAVNVDYSNFTEHELSDGLKVYTTMLPDHLIPDKDQFEVWWNHCPDTRSKVRTHQGYKEIARFQQAHLRDYPFSGQVAEAIPLPDIWAPHMEWSQTICSEFNGVLCNYYNARHGHHISPHQDETTTLSPGKPILTMSFGEERVFRLTSKHGEPWNFTVLDGSVVIIPWETNARWKHDVRHLARFEDRRISITVRAFNDAVATFQRRPIRDLADKI